MQTVRFNPTQVHMLDMASHIKAEKSLQMLKDQLAQFYAKMIDDEMDELWASGEWDEQKLVSLRGAHFRTAYK